jgi:hypothetical protein
MAIIKKTKGKVLVRVYRKGALEHAVEMKISTATMENSMDFPQEIRNRTT